MKMLFFIFIFFSAATSLALEAMVIPPDCKECQALLASGTASVINNNGVLLTPNLPSQNLFSTGKGRITK